MERRTFLKTTASLGAMVGLGLQGFGIDGLDVNAAVKPNSDTGNGAAAQIGRPVRVASIGFPMSKPLQEICELVDKEGALGTDLIALPETCRGQNTKGITEETLNGPTITAMAGLARKHGTYIACPIDRKDGSRRFNSIVLLDRKGQVACVYNKVFPYWPELGLKPSTSPSQQTPVHDAEFGLQLPVDLGQKTLVYNADFGRVGFATCFDINFPEVWHRLAEQGAELVIWSSGYSGGAALQAHALNLHFYIVSSTQTPDCSAYDITGKRLLYSRGEKVNVSRIALDLDRGIYMTDYNIGNRDKLLKEHSEDIMQESFFELEGWFVLRAKRPGVSARKLAQQYGLVELYPYITRSRQQIDKLRGWEFAKADLYTSCER